MSGAAGAAAAAAAAAKRQRDQEEEEEVTPLNSDPSGAVEYKIIRSATGAFKHPASRWMRRTPATPHPSDVSYLDGCCGSAGCFAASFSRISAHRRGPIKEPPVALRSMTTPVPVARSKYADAS